MAPDCPLCRSGGARPHHAEAGVRYHRCPACGFVFLHPVPSADDLERLYQEEHGATFHHGAEIAGAFEKGLEADHRLRIVRAALSAAPDRRALEIGCGAGYLLERLRREGWSVVGTELSDAYIRHARERLGLDVRREPPAGPFGAVLAFNVLSHVPDPAAAARAWHGLLKPGGVLVLETGNAAEVAPERVGPFGAPEHVWHFSETTLRGLLSDAGFADIRVARRNVEWQRGLLRRVGSLRRPRTAGRAGPSSAAAPASPPRERAVKRAWISALLALRFHAGRWGADRRHFCTLFVTARK
ncbi:MAG TPA: class I SAM-dependent methyltransferase [Planctomycetota bacterium]|nr:class I SAM-dependent methyltransferase [Planctomycetota bacterium]